MKEFEKWDRPYHLNDLSLSNEVRTKHKKQERQKGWKAALEYVLNNIDIRCTRTIDVQRFIEQELKIWEE
jgi:hypothetical protein